MVFNLSVLELFFIGNARVFCAFTTRQASLGKRKFEELLRLKGWSWHILTAPLLSKYFCHVTFLLWISHGQTGKFVINSHRDSAFRVIFSANKKGTKKIETHFCFQLPKEGCHSIARAIARELFPLLVNWKLFFLSFVEKVVIIQGESRLVTYLKVGNIVMNLLDVP